MHTLNEHSPIGLVCTEEDCSTAISSLMSCIWAFTPQQNSKCTDRFCLVQDFQATAGGMSHIGRARHILLRG